MILWAYMYIAPKDFSFKTIYIFADRQVSSFCLFIHMSPTFNIFDFFRAIVLYAQSPKEKKCQKSSLRGSEEVLYQLGVIKNQRLAETFC
jgi:hypothetical protein